jgi:uncharacterized membrane protein
MKNKLTVKKMTLCAMFISLSVLGAFFKPFGNSIAFDSMPAFVAASIMGPVFGALVGLLGHFISASISGFPLSIGIHVVIAVEMALVMFAYGHLIKKVSIVISGVIAVILNGVAATAVFILIPNMGMPFFLAMVGPLTLISAINVILAVIIHFALDKAYKKHIL